jgi:hypothetical protein
VAKPQRTIPADMLAEPMARAKRLAEKMARVLNNEDVSDIAIAVALLTSGVVHQYADDRVKAGELMAGIRKLEDRFVAKALGVEDVKLQ